ncbi:MAG: hypothetical protein AAGA31_00920 [Bacteroidota bacterium]
MKYIVLSLFVLLTPYVLPAQCDNASELSALSLEAFLTNDADKWADAVKLAETLPTTIENDINLAKLYFGAAGAAFSREDKAAIKDYSNRMEVPLDRVLEEEVNHPAANGLYSAYLGMLISRTPMKGMLYGGKAGRMAKKGAEKGPNSPEALYCLGSNPHYTPTTWGGDPEEAVVALKKSVAAFPPTANGCDWFHLQAYALLGQAQANAGDKAGARQTYLKALQLQPKFYWVSKVLLPGLDKAR